MSDSTTGMSSIWVHLFDLHAAFKREDIAEIASQLAVFPVTDQTSAHVDVSSAYMFALGRYGEDRTEFATMVRESYAQTYEASYEALLDVLLEESAGEHVSQKTDHS